MANEHKNEHILHLEITGMKKRYSDPKLYIPKENGRAIIKPNKRWYVYFYWRTDPNGVLDKRFAFYKDLNRLKTVSERKRMGKALVDAYKIALDRGWNPETKKTIKQPSKIITIGQALDFALEVKKDNIKEATYIDYDFRSSVFKKWLKKNFLIGLPAKEITVDHIYDFIDFLQLEYRQENGKKLSNNSIDNTKRVISALFTEMKNKRIIPHNFVKDIPKLKAKAVKNKPFTASEIKDIVAQLKKEDPYLISFLAFMIYGVMRPREIIRLKIGDINLKDKIITVETKTSAFAIIRIIDKLKPFIEQMEIQKFNPELNLFTPEDHPAEWITARLDSKVSYFGKRFTKVIRAMGFNNEYSLYSIRHFAIWMLYNGMRKQGKNEREIIHSLMPITRHKSEAGLRNYLRDIQVVLPSDYSEVFDFEL